MKKKSLPFVWVIETANEGTAWQSYDSFIYKKQAEEFMREYKKEWNYEFHRIRKYVREGK